MSEQPVCAAAPAGAAIDPFFEVIRGGKWNACIGMQGTEENYVDGYMEAALELASAVIDKEQYGKRDTLALPILYNARHAVELALKFAIDRLVEAGVLREAHAKNHDIRSHWDYIASAKLGDVVLAERVMALQPFIESLHSIDEDGQQLRYAETQDGQKSLQDKAVCNLELIRASLVELSAILLALRHRVLDVVDERRAGAFTAELSRKDLFDIAGMIPPRARWGEDAFTGAKTKVCERFGLSGKQFAKALDLIQQHREMGSLIGLEFQLAYLTDEDVHLIVASWAKANPERQSAEGRGMSYFEIDRNELVEHWRAGADADRVVLAALSTDKIADFQTLYYIGNLRLFSEEYEPRLEGARRELAVGEDPWAMVHHIMTKSNLPWALARGLEIVGRPRLAAELRGLRADFVD